MARDYGHVAHHVKVGKPPFAAMGDLPDAPAMPKKRAEPGTLPDRAEVARHLIAMRDALGMSSSEMADSISCDRRDYGRYENLKRDLPLPKAWSIYKRHDFNLNFIYDGKLSGVPAEHREAVIRALNQDPRRKAS